MKEKIIVITGGSQGIGRCMAIEFAKLGATVIICARTKKDVDQTSAEISALGGYCEGFELDVSNSKKVKEFFNVIIKKYQTIDVLINCAGIYGPIGSLEINDPNLWERTIKINLLGTVYCIRNVIPIMKERKMGKIITLSGQGVGGRYMDPYFSAYIASKSAIVGLTEALAKELKEYNIQINAIAPGPVNTRFLDQVLGAKKWVGKKVFEKARKQHVEGGTSPNAAAQLAIFLARDESNYITGKLLSAVWDDYKSFDTKRDKLEKTSLYNLRRIDNSQFMGSDHYEL